MRRTLVEPAADRQPAAGGAPEVRRPADLATLYERAFFHIDVSRLCNFSCHYCTVPAEVFGARKLAKKREHLGDWARKP